MPTKSIAVRLPDELYDYLVARAEKEHRTLSNMIISLLLTAQEQDCSVDIRFADSTDRK